jgi:hypothetical protein
MAIVPDAVGRESHMPAIKADGLRLSLPALGPEMMQKVVQMSLPARAS